MSLDPGIAVGVLHNLVGNLLDVALDLSICEFAANETLGGKEGVFGVDDGLTLGGDADQALAFLGEADNRWSCSCTWRKVQPGSFRGTYHARLTFSILNDSGLLSLGDGDSRVGSACHALATAQLRRD